MHQETFWRFAPSILLQCNLCASSTKSVFDSCLLSCTRSAQHDLWRSFDRRAGEVQAVGERAVDDSVSALFCVPRADPQPDAAVARDVHCYQERLSRHGHAANDDTL
jgi:hypothetical protein